MARRRARVWAQVILLALLTPLVSYYTSGGLDARGQSTLTLRFNAEAAYTATSDQLSFGNRIPGTTAHKACANYFKNAISLLGPEFLVIDHNFTVYGVECQNVMGILNPTIQESIVIIGAHYDSRAISEKDTNNPYSPCPGANDGASGCGVMLELARDLYQIRSILNTQVWFVFFDAEDQGNGAISGWDWIEGSTKFANSLETFLSPQPLSAVKLMILLDMVGGTNLVFAKDSVSDSSVQETFFLLGRDLMYASAFPTNPVSLGSIIDDHKQFAYRGIPSVDLIIDFRYKTNPWPYHHTTEDTLAHISVDSLNITGRTVENFFHEYYVSASNGGGGRVPFWANYITETEAMMISAVFGACVVVGLTCAYKAYLLKKPEVLKDKRIIKLVSS